jgi:hypothetical protein
VVLSESMENQQGFFPAACFDVMQEVLPVVNVAFLDHAARIKICTLPLYKLQIEGYYVIRHYKLRYF